MDLKERILTITTQQTMQVGVSSTTMDNIARSCGISKRTLYELFPDKLTLLTEAMRFSIGKQREKLNELIEKSDNTLNALLSIYSHIRDQVSHTAQVMIDDIRRLYPSLYQEYLNEHFQNNRNFALILKEGQKQGFIRKNADIDVAISGFSIIMLNIKRNNPIAISQFNTKQILDETFITLIRGLASQEGIQIIDKFLEERETTKTE